MVKITPWLTALVPFFTLASLSKKTRGFTLYPGGGGTALGAALVAAAVAVGYGLYPVTGPAGTALSLWLLGSAGAAVLVASRSPMAFVKPICVRCRLLEVIKEHEAIHLSGVASEKAVWESMRERHSVASLSLESDPSICTFCPIPKRLAEH